MLIDPLMVASNLGSYEVVFTEDKEVSFPSLDPKHVIAVVDRNVWERYQASVLRQFAVYKIILLDVHEEMKTLNTVMTIYDEIMQYAPKKNMTLISVGGGITQDVTGFVASTLYRGIRWIYIPTTVLAQADSCIGSKTSLNYEHYKNLLGTFFPPKMVVIHPALTDSLAEIDYFSGLGEIAKLHLLGGNDLLEELVADYDAIMERNREALTRAVYRSLTIKKAFIEEDEFDSGKRNLLNYGHCFGHAIESAAHYAIPHGQAVVVGMMMANEVAMRRGDISTKEKESIERRVLSPLVRFDWKLIRDIDSEKVVEAMGKDKKRTGADLALILPGGELGMQKIHDLKHEEALSVLRSFVNDDRN